MKRNLLKRIMAGFWAAAFVGMSSMTALAADSVDVNGSADTPAIPMSWSDTRIRISSPT